MSETTQWLYHFPKKGIMISSTMERPPHRATQWTSKKTHGNPGFPNRLSRHGRFYHRASPLSPPDSQTTAPDSQKVITVLENQVADLQKQLELSNDRETALIDEKAKLLDLLSKVVKSPERCR